MPVADDDRCTRARRARGRCAGDRVPVRVGAVESSRSAGVAPALGRRSLLALSAHRSSRSPRGMRRTPPTFMRRPGSASGCCSTHGTRPRDPAARVKPWPWADTHPVARLIVPAHRVELLVLAGANGRTLAWGPGHVEGTAAPGDAGNAVVTAHRDTHFAFLRDLVPGDRIVVETPAGTIRALSRRAHARSPTIARCVCRRTIARRRSRS